jgi:hypothetical protein
VPLERRGFELLKQLDQVFGSVQHDGLIGSAPKRARRWQPQGCARTIDLERDARRAHDCYHILGPGAPHAAHARRDWVTQGESYLAGSDIDRRNAASEDGQYVTLGLRHSCPLPDHQPSGRLASWIDHGADHARLAGREHYLWPDER